MTGSTMAIRVSVPLRTQVSALGTYFHVVIIPGHVGADTTRRDVAFGGTHRRIGLLTAVLGCAARGRRRDQGPLMTVN